VSVAPFYGGMPGVAKRLEAATSALDRFMTSGDVAIVPAYKARDEEAAMFFELDYYGNTARGAVPAWKNAMATISWSYWFTFDGLRAADHVTTPTLFVHSDGCVFPDNVRTIHARLRGPKQLVWSEGAQTDFYDQSAQVTVAVDAADAFLRGAGAASSR